MLTNNSYLPGNWPPELDVIEAFGATAADGEGGANQAHWDVHSTNTSQQAEGWATVNANQYNSYNTYGVLWTPQTLTFCYRRQSSCDNTNAFGLQAEDVHDRKRCSRGHLARLRHGRERNEEDRVYSGVLEQLQHTRRRPP
jgi:hypothetical protein